MNAFNQARMAYANTAAPIKTDRGTEYETFAQITRRIQHASDRGKAGFSDLAAALFDNNRLWVLLATDVADAGNALPQPLRAQIFYLAEFTLQHTPKILKGDEAADVLIDINKNIMRGLRQSEVAA